MDHVVIRIRYSDLAPGTNGDTIREGSRVVVYFVPGLSTTQRKAVLRRLHQAARRGQKPKLPPAQLALALSIDRVRRSARNLGAIVRLHPAGSMLPMFGLATLIALFLITSVSVRILHGPYLGPGSPPGENGTQPGHAAQASPYRTTISASRAPSVGGVALTSNSDPSATASTAATSSSTSAGSSTTSPSSPAANPGTTTGTPGASGTVSTPVATVSVGASSTTSQGVSAAANVAAGSAVSVKAAASVSASSVAATTKISAGTANVGVGVTLDPTGAAASVSVAGTSVSVKAATTTPAPSTSSGTCLDIGPLGICLSA
jgi:hypothetical protein